MTLTQKGLSAVAMGAALFVAACTSHDGAVSSEDAASSEAIDKKQAALKETGRTIKPGAAVAFSHNFRSPPKVGVYSVVEISMTDYYDDGILRARAMGDEGLEVFGAPATFSYALDGPAPGVWDVSVKPLAEGVHYLNITVQVEKNGVAGPARAHSVRIDVGDAAANKSKAPVDAIEMQAEETIE